MGKAVRYQAIRRIDASLNILLSSPLTETYSAWRTFVSSSLSISLTYRQRLLHQYLRLLQSLRFTDFSAASQILCNGLASVVPGTILTVIGLRFAILIQLGTRTLPHSWDFRAYIMFQIVQKVFCYRHQCGHVCQQARRKLCDFLHAFLSVQ